MKNIIPPPTPEPLWRGFLRKFADPLIIVLLVVFVLSSAISLYEYGHGAGTEVLFEPLGVLVALLLATGVGFILEVKAEKEFQVLNQTNDEAPVKVLRDGQFVEVPKKDITVGDLVRLESGDEVPADGCLEDSQQLRVDESAFTGEPSVTKSHKADRQDAHATYASDLLLRGSTLLEGYALLRITAIGINTEEGRGAMKVREGRTVQTPLNRQLSALGKQVSGAAVAIAALVVAGRMLCYFLLGEGAGEQFLMLHFVQYTLESLMLAVALIAVAVPEGLPMSITMSLALSMRRMLRENNLVRKLHACETMGAATVICTDKTGTLTQNRMQVVEHLSLPLPDTEGLPAHEALQQAFVLCCALNSTAELSTSADGTVKALGNPTEGALLHWLADRGVDYRTLRSQWTIIDRVPFSSERKFMSTTVERDGVRLTFLKGASEILLPTCQPTDVDIMKQLAEWQGKAMRTLGFAVETGGKRHFLGIVGIMDPLRGDVREAIATCTQRAGVRVIMVTGDTVGTATEIGRQIGLFPQEASTPSKDSENYSADSSHKSADSFSYSADSLHQPAGSLSSKESEAGTVLTGPGFAALSDEEALQRVATLKIIARARPDDKARLVALLQQLGEVVAVTGDGTNDAPALAKAQVGLSMGSGTAHAKEASDITIIDDSFASINRAILWGRSLYQNIRRFLLFQLTVNVAACLIVFIGAFTGTESPLTVTQMLWVNLIMDTFAAMALSSLPADPKVMDEKPRSQKAHIIDNPMLRRIAGVGLTQFLLAAVVWEGPILFPGHFPVVQFFTFFVFLQFWNLFNVRYYRTSRSLLLDICDILRHPSRFHSHFSTAFVAIALAILLGQLAIVEVLPELFQVSRLSMEELLTIVGLTAPFLIVPDIYRTVKAGKAANGANSR